MIALLLLGSLLVYIGIGSIVYKVVVKPRLGTWRGLLVTGIIFFLIPVWDIIPGVLYFNYLCEKEGGQKIYRVVEANGYFKERGLPFGCDAQCVMDLLGSWSNKHYYIEAYVLHPKEYNYAKSPGLYRFYLVAQPSTECNKYDEIQKLYSKRRLNKAPEGYCVVGKSIEAREARYSYADYERDYKHLNILGVGRMLSRITDSHSGETVALATEVLWYGGWFLRWISGFGGVGSPDVCPTKDDYLPYGLHNGIIYKTLN